MHIYVVNGAVCPGSHKIICQRVACLEGKRRLCFLQPSRVAQRAKIYALLTR